MTVPLDMSELQTAITLGNFDRVLCFAANTLTLPDSLNTCRSLSFLSSCISLSIIFGTVGFDSNKVINVLNDSDKLPSR